LLSLLAVKKAAHVNQNRTVVHNVLEFIQRHTLESVVGYCQDDAVKRRDE
jgi:hypothetical protein